MHNAPSPYNSVSMHSLFEEYQAFIVTLSNKLNAKLPLAVVGLLKGRSAVTAKACLIPLLFDPTACVPPGVPGDEVLALPRGHALKADCCFDARQTQHGEVPRRRCCQPRVAVQSPRQLKPTLSTPSQGGASRSSGRHPSARGGIVAPNPDDSVP